MLNPITYTEKIARDFLRYQLSAYPLADAQMQAQMRDLLNLDETRNTPLMKGPYVSLSRMFRQGAAVDELVSEGILHPHLSRLVMHSHLYGHQEAALRSILGGSTTLVSTGTGSGKTESFLYPIISRCLELRDNRAKPGIAAVIVYPMNALAEDQLGRLRELLCGTGVSFGIYVGNTPERRADVSGIRLEPSASRETYLNALEREREVSEPRAIHPPEERVSREEMREPGNQPRILLTNVKQLELLLTRQRDVELFDDATLEFLVVDEAHTFSGAMGAETACLIRRLRAYCGRTQHDTICVATSATIADPESGDNAARAFAARFFGVDASGVTLINEEYQEETWAEELVKTSAPSGDPLVQLENVLNVLRGVDCDKPTTTALEQLKTHLQTLLGVRIDMSDWRRSLYDILSARDVVWEISAALSHPKSLTALSAEVSDTLNRPLHEAEILTWLALGAAARKNDRPLLRPVVHGFLRGVDGAVVTFPEDSNLPKLWLAAEDAVQENEELARLHVMTCTTCGQHYFEHFVEDFQFFDGIDKEPGGGESYSGTRLWPGLEAKDDYACRVVMVNRLAFNSVNDEDADTEIDHTAELAHKRLNDVCMCRYCGALQGAETERCGSCGRTDAHVALHVVIQKEDTPGKLTSCISCRRPSNRRYGRYREPARPIRAVNVSDVHVLAQSMLQHAERKRLLIFADNRQDAAFQAGWMQDHARRFRLRSLMYEILRKSGPSSVGDMVHSLNDLLENDDSLSRALIPEVWRTARKERMGKQHSQERTKYLRLQVLRELAIGNRQRMGLEPWGRMRVNYADLKPDHEFITQWASAMGVTPQELADGIASILDSERRRQLIYDPITLIYTRYWIDNDVEIERGYMPMPQGGPQGIKLQREPGDHAQRVKQLLSDKGITTLKQISGKWGLDQEQAEAFIKGLWQLLARELKLLVPVTLQNARNKALPDCAGVYQLDVDSLQMIAHKGVWVCSKCRRSYARPSPHALCIGWHCDGTIEFRNESPDDYDLMLLDENFTLVRPREHSAQVPGDERDQLERLFKSHGEYVNTLVSTPTLELGVDIGSLDSVLMRNVPPLPANYWQRAGRAGRRHRMAVNLTYARPSSHDRAYFADPLKMLCGPITPPSFNLKNSVMVRKHVHSTVLGIFHQWARAGGDLSEYEVNEIASALKACFPSEIKGYLFDNNGDLRCEAFDTAPMRIIVSKYIDKLHAKVVETFKQGWPADDYVVVEESLLRTYIEQMPEELTVVIRRLEKRLQWALNQLKTLDDRRRVKGTLDFEEQEMWRRCDNLVKKLKGQVSRRRRESEGIDDTYTFSVLAAEGYLPGYGLDNGSVAGTHLVPKNEGRMNDWVIRRAPSMAIREYVPGNLIYANGHRFSPRFFQLEPEQPTMFQVDTSNEAIREEGMGSPQEAAKMGTTYLAAVPICDVQLPHHASISDDEEFRFQLSSAIYGYELQRHEEGKAYYWQSQSILWRRSVHLRLVNVGPSAKVNGSSELGFPICTFCGQSRTPFLSEKEFLDFQKAHKERCGQEPLRVGIYADVVADACTFGDFDDRSQGFSVVEAIRNGASRVLDMEIDDLQLLAIGHTGGTKVDLVLYDPMPGGSGLLEQMTQRWGDVCEAAYTIVGHCPSDCDSACVDCLLTYRNAHYHRYLDRHAALEILHQYGKTLEFSHAIPARLPDESDQSEATNRAEEILENMLLRAGFERPEAQKRIDLGRPLGYTLPDFYYEDPRGVFEGIAIYLDGRGKYADSATSKRSAEQQIRQELNARNYRVIEINVSDLTDRVTMTRYFRMLANSLLDRESARNFPEYGEWFE